MQFIVQIILARILLPVDYGIIALVVIFISISYTFVESGLGTALIQKKKITDTDCSSIFYLSLGIALVFYCLLFIGAPHIASFYIWQRRSPRPSMLLLAINGSKCYCRT